MKINGSFLKTITCKNKVRIKNHVKINGSLKKSKNEHGKSHEKRNLVKT